MFAWVPQPAATRFLHAPPAATHTAGSSPIPFDSGDGVFYVIVSRVRAAQDHQAMTNERSASMSITEPDYTITIISATASSSSARAASRSARQ